MDAPSTKASNATEAELASQRAALAARTGIPVSDIVAAEGEVRSGKVSNAFMRSAMRLFGKYPKTMKKLSE